MLTRMFTRLPVRKIIQTRNANGFNKYPVYKLKPYGYSGNAYLAVGVISFVGSIWLAQSLDTLYPRGLPGYGGLFTVQGKFPMDLTPDELLERRKNE